MSIRRTVQPVIAAALLWLALCFPSWAVAAGAAAASFALTEQSLESLRQEGLPKKILEKLETLKDQKFDTEDKFLEAVRQGIGNDQTVRYKVRILKYSTDEITVEINSITEALKAQKRTIDAILAQNKALEMRLAELEAARGGRPPQIEAKAVSGERKELEQRVKELEDAQTTRDDATRSIIQDAFSKLGSKINQSVTLGGTLEVTGGYTENFAGPSEGLLSLGTAQLDLEIDVNEWTKASLIVEYNDGTNVAFPTTSGFQTGVDRINLDTASLTIGDPQRFPPFLTAGRIILPFGISTGNPVTDVMTIEDPLTIEGFEMRQTAVGIGLGFPTPAVTPATPPVTPPPVRPLVINPFVSSIAKALGYKPLPTRKTLTPVTPKPAPPLFNVGIYSYNGDTFEGVEKTGGFKPEKHIAATAGFRTQGHCGRPFDQLSGSAFCPWSIDIDVDYNSSVFDSRFLGFEYNKFLGQIGFVDGMAAHVKATLGRVSLVGEWNGAIERAVFVDDLGGSVNIKPSAWQISLGYQFDWNPWVEEIGAQGDYITIGYSESRDFAGVMQVTDGSASRVGNLPRRRIMVGAGEWVLDNLRFAVEYSHNLDYPVEEGGTGESANGFLSQFTVVW